MENGARIDEKDLNGNTATHIAAAGGFKDVVEYLRDAGASFIVTNKRGLIPLHSSIAGDNIETFMICKFASERQIDLSKLEERERKFFIRNPSLANRTKSKLTPLMLSIINKWEKIFYHLIELGVYFDDQDDKGYTALHYAIINKDLHKARMLIQYGADTKIMTYKQQTAYDLASSKQLKLVSRFFVKFWYSL